MPVYEYVCRDCRSRFEQLRPMAERLSSTECSSCGSRRTELAFSVPGHVGATAGAVPGPCGRVECGGGACQGGF